MGACYPRKIFNFRRSKIDFGPLLGNFCMVETERSFASAGSLCS